MAKHAQNYAGYVVEVAEKTISEKPKKEIGGIYK
jgi:hypothetical protein